MRGAGSEVRNFKDANPGFTATLSTLAEEATESKGGHFAKLK